MKRKLVLVTALTAAIALPAFAQDTKSPATIPNVATAQPSIVLTEQEAKAWIDKPVYSSDGKKLGEVASFERDADNKVTEMHADIGGFLGFGQHHVKLLPAQLTLQSDRVVVDITSAQAKGLPKIPR